MLEYLKHLVLLLLSFSFNLLIEYTLYVLFVYSTLFNSTTMSILGSSFISASIIDLSMASSPIL